MQVLDKHTVLRWGGLWRVVLGMAATYSGTMHNTQQVRTLQQRCTSGCGSCAHAPSCSLVKQARCVEAVYLAGCLSTRCRWPV